MSHTLWKNSLVLWVVLLNGNVHALDEQRLWLPVSHERLYLKLKSSAEAAESLTRCESVLRGTIDLDQSALNHKPIFRILCRQPDGNTYNEMVDGENFDTLTTPAKAPVLNAQEQEALRLQEQARIDKAVDDVKRDFLQQCRDSFAQKTRLFLNLTLLEDDFEEVFNYESIDDDGHLVNVKASYRWPFNAENMQKQPLQYESFCECNESGHTFTIKSRR